MSLTREVRHRVPGVSADLALRLISACKATPIPLSSLDLGAIEQTVSEGMALDSGLSAIREVRVINDEGTLRAAFGAARIWRSSAVTWNTKGLERVSVRDHLPGSGVMETLRGIPSVKMIWELPDIHAWEFVAHDDYRAIEEVRNDRETLGVVSAWSTPVQAALEVYGFSHSMTRDLTISLRLFELGVVACALGRHALYVCPRPDRVALDVRNRLHCANAPSVIWLSDITMYHIHGVRVPRSIIETPELITVSHIDSERNAEVRRVLIERYGVERYVLDGCARTVSTDKYGALLYKEVPGDEPICMVHVKNSTPEPDGSIRDYFLRVPPSVTTPADGIAWTFGLRPGTYAPKKMT